MKLRDTWRLTRLAKALQEVGKEKTSSAWVDSTACGYFCVQVLPALVARADTRWQPGCCCRCWQVSDGRRSKADRRVAGVTAAQLSVLLAWRQVPVTALVLVAAEMGRKRLRAAVAQQTRCRKVGAQVSPRRMPREAAAAPQIWPALSRSSCGMTAVPSSIRLHHKIERHCTAAERSGARGAFVFVPSQQISPAERGHRASCSWKRRQCLQDQH